MFSNTFLKKLKDTIPYVILWFVAGVLYIIIEKGMMGDLTIYPSTGNPYDFKSSLMAVAVITLFIGFGQGILERTVFRNLFRGRPFIFKILFKTVLYAGLMLLAQLLISFPLNSLALDKPLFHPEVVRTVKGFMTNFIFLSILLYMAIFMFLGLFIDEMLQNIGGTVALNFFTGRYHRSKVETRVFMFLDMKSSTTIAERLGHEQYYQLLNSYYEDMTRALIETKGEIYQYVGDEIVVSWRDQKGLEQNNCIRCFFMIREAISRHADRYEKRYGLVPEFKAGFHMGEVTTGEVGVVKKELLFTGDVINTTARIQGLCNELQSSLLVSKDLLDALSLNKDYQVDPKGEYELRGRDQKIQLYSVLRTEKSH